MQQLQNRIPGWLFAILMAIAVLLALIAIIPFIGQAVSMVGWAVIGFILRLRGVSFSKNPKLLGVVGIGLIIGLIPFVGGFFAYIWGVYKQIQMVRKEDKKVNVQIRNSTAANKKREMQRYWQMQQEEAAYRAEAAQQ